MYTELIKIIEGGLKGDKEKVLNYAKNISDLIEKKGDVKVAQKIRLLLDNKKGSLITLDSLSTKPVDSESRLEMVDIQYYTNTNISPILSEQTHKSIELFIKSYVKRDSILKAGINIKSSLLLYGPPGCGKSTLAKYVSLKTGLPLITVRLDGMISSLLGSTAKNIRKIFDYASKRECILFLDEFDVIAKLRDDKNDLGELKRVVNSLLQNIDDFSENSIIIAATNHHQLLDSAVWRRFSNILLLDKPQKNEIELFLNRHLTNIDNDIYNSKSKFEQIVSSLENKSYSDIETIINNTIKKVIINEKYFVNNYDLLTEIFLHEYHSINDEDIYLKFLLANGVTQRELNEELGYSLRKVREISKL
ncbi:MAG: ATP-binding protein [Candidatus Cloacimonetes bacterium]|nr:ATP-binding protein [Candidatus Cloacimonadota bacterium]